MAAAAAAGWRPGLIQHACTRALSGFRRFPVDIALADDAAEGRLDMAAGAAEAVVEIEMAEGGIEIVAPQQADHAAAQPDAFGIPGRAGDRAAASANSASGFLTFFRISPAARLSLRLVLAALGKCGGRCEGQRGRQTGSGQDTRTGKDIGSLGYSASPTGCATLCTGFGQ